MNKTDRIMRAIYEWDRVSDFIIDDHYDSYPDMNPDCTEKEFNEALNGRLSHGLESLLKEHGVTRAEWASKVREIKQRAIERGN